MIGDWWEWYRVSGIEHTTITIPLVETSILFVILSICLLFRLSRTGLIVAYLFVYRWGWCFLEQSGLMGPQHGNMFLTGYIVFGILVFTLAIIGMIMVARARE